MTTCKPCITVRDYAKIIWRNLVLFNQNVRKDMKAYALINASVCELSKTKSPSPTLEEQLDQVRKIREEAKKNYNPDNVPDWAK